MNLIRNLIGLLIILTLLPVCMQAFRYTSNISFDYDEINDEIALQQLREQLLIAYDMNISADRLSFRYKNDDFTLSLVNGMLILQPGTQIYLNDVDNLYFETEHNCIYVNYERNSKEYKRVIGSESGIYLDDFSDCDVVNDEPDSSES